MKPETGSKPSKRCSSPDHSSFWPRKSVVADQVRKAGSHFNEGRTSGDAAACCEVNHVGSVLCGGRDRFLRADVGFYQSSGKALGGSDGIRHCRNHGGLSLHLFNVRVAPPGALLRRGGSGRQ